MKKRKKESGALKRTAIGAGLIIGLYCLFALVMSAFLITREDGTELTGIFSLAALMISAGLGTLISAKLFGSKSALSALSPACAVLVLYTAAALIVTGGKVELSHAMDMLCFLMMSVLFAFLSVPHAKPRHKVKR